MSIPPEMYNGINLREGHNEDTGQMAAEERRKLMDMILYIKPKHIIDIGTWRGVGSTYIAAVCASRIGAMVYTYETSADLSVAAKNLYLDKYPGLMPFVEFRNKAVSPDDFPMNMEGEEVGVLILDGGNSGADYEAVKESLAPRCGVFCHDWLDNKSREVWGVFIPPIWRLYAYENINTDDCAMFVRGDW